MTRPTLVLIALLAAPSAAADTPALSRSDFNRLAVSADAGVYWRGDTDGDKYPDNDELTPLRGELPNIATLWPRLVEMRRRQAVQRELDQGRVTLIETDFSKLGATDRAAMRHLEKAAGLIDALYQTQTGALALKGKVPKDDAASQALFERNQSVQCGGPDTADDSFCNATSDFSVERSFAWPEGVALDEAFCDKVGREPNAKQLLDPFHVVRRKGKGFQAVPYTRVYGERMAEVATHLRAAAKALAEDEAPFRAYLEAAAKGFDTNSWWDADQAWSQMNARNSRWYLRVGPDETYFDPCQVKSGFHMSLARVDRSALDWQDRLTAVRGDMEAAIGQAIGAPYAARDVRFQLPEFIEIVLNAGDSRSGMGATIGQSLPNFGPVAAESRGRTVAMANLYTDPDSMRIARKRAESLFGDETMQWFSDDPGAARLDTVLHEATHNFGPTGSWKVDGKAPEEVFGGRLDAIMEELKAQTGSYYLLYFLEDRGMASEREVRAGIVGSIAWSFGHISRGMFTGSGKPRTYSVLSAIQVLHFMKAGALTWSDERFHVHFDKMEAAVGSLMKTVGQIKARGDREAGQALVDEATAAQSQRRIRATNIRERVWRYPKASFVYRVRYE